MRKYFNFGRLNPSVDLISSFWVLIQYPDTYGHLNDLENIITKCHENNNLVCVAPDVGGVERARSLGRKINAGIAIVDKRRPEPGKSDVMNVVGTVEEKTCIIVDDIIDSGGTIVNAAKALVEKGAKEIYVYITHGVLSGEAVKKIKNSKIKKLIVTVLMNVL